VPEEKSERYAAKLQRVERMARRTAADLEHAQTQSFGWRGAFILGWSGMRGVVTLAHDLGRVPLISRGFRFPGAGEAVSQDQRR
ncbi:hypothetical protein XM48_10070, partial [Leucobacter sp. Ag1]